VPRHPSVASPYEDLAPFYDAFTAGSDYEAWSRHVLRLARERGLTGNRLLDVACGTGNSFLPFARRGFAVSACDASQAMLDEAARKAPAVELLCADLRVLPPLGQFDLVTCFDDALNHLDDEAELGAALRGLRSNLAPTGLAVFDLNSLLAYRTTFASDAISCRDGVLFAWRGETDAGVDPGCRASARLDVLVPDDDERYERLRVRLSQRHFPPHRVTALLAGAGLDCLGVHGVLDDGTPVGDPDESRQLKVLYVARPARGGDSA
jgi:SAM-dependent methyltransferase